MAPLELLQIAVPSAVTNNLAEIASLGVLFALKAWQENFAGKKRETRQSVELDTHISDVKKEIAEVRQDVRDVKAICIGVDGENGIRGDQREDRRRIMDLEDRERERLERKAYDRRSGA